MEERFIVIIIIACIITGLCVESMCKKQIKTIEKIYYEQMGEIETIVQDAENLEECKENILNYIADSEMDIEEYF